MKQKNMAHPGELDLAVRASKGDAEAFRQLVAFYEPRLLAYLSQMLGGQDAAHDLVQETLLAAYRALPRWQPPLLSRSPAHQDTSDKGSYIEEHPFAPWLYRIATNLALNHLKSLKTARTGASSLQYTKFAGISLEHVTSKLSLEDRYVTRELLREALGHLSQEDAACLLLRFVEGEKYSNIAAQLGISQEAARKRVTRGLAALRTIYHQLDRETRS